MKNNKTQLIYKKTVIAVLLVIPFFTLQAQTSIASPSTITQNIQDNISTKSVGLSIDHLISQTSKVYTKPEAEKAVRFITDEIDWQTLYTSGNWSKVITLWVDLYSNHINDVFAFTDDFEKISKKITDPTQYADFARKTAFALTRQNRAHYINSIAPLVRDSGKIKDFNGVLAVYMQAAPGTYAPELIFKVHDNNVVLKSKEMANGNFSQTMLLFYASGCGPCEHLLMQMPDYMNDLKNKRIRIISVSADPDENTFENKAKDLPWEDKFWDYENIKGENFQKYAITGTPTIFLLDKTGKILVRTSSLDEFLDYINKSK
ncbi:TlpA family protein disulfide reductase [Chryseobacterium sp. G0201]|uniref:TlpA family protein disulfide reductase n=1 Tax=Chryseobacterium sp. G0201 TaxID=2487065 RepID=UPI000F4FDBDB|nr:thioredoxin family protein [Chryseobacterium sp. G0201]AZA54798.1 hypothetical protein EG348_18220 [Chryseobacterium sp. G0201]